MNNEREQIRLLIKALYSDHERQKALQELAKFGSLAIDMLVNTMEGGSFLDEIPDNSRRLRIAEALASIGPSSTPRLLHSLNHKNYWVRMAAIEAIDLIRDPRAVDSLIKILEHDTAHTPSLAAKVLMNLGDQRAILPLARALGKEYSGEIPHDPSENIARALASLCAQSNVPRHILLEATRILKEYGQRDWAKTYIKVVGDEQQELKPSGF